LSYYFNTYPKLLTSVIFCYISFHSRVLGQRLRETGTISHAYVARNLPIIARQFYTIINDDNEISRWEISEIRRIAREIEVLAPAGNENDIRKDNSEYPWQNGKGEVQISGEYNFPNIFDKSRTIIRLIRLIRTASKSYIK